MILMSSRSLRSAYSIALPILPAKFESLPSDWSAYFFVYDVIKGVTPTSVDEITFRKMAMEDPFFIVKE